MQSVPQHSLRFFYLPAHSFHFIPFLNDSIVIVALWTSVALSRARSIETIPGWRDVDVRERRAHNGAGTPDSGNQVRQCTYIHTQLQSVWPFVVSPHWGGTCKRIRVL